jgi:hypothetical protein
MFDHISYLEKISRESIYINHSVDESHFSISSGYTQTEQLLASALRSSEIQIVAIDDISGSYDNNDNVNLYDTQSCSFMVLMHVSTIDDRDAINEARKTCILIARKIFARMRYEAYLASKLPPNHDSIGLRQLNQNSFRYFSVGPLADNYFGYDISFTFGNQEAVIYNPDEWNSINS